MCERVSRSHSICIFHSRVQSVGAHYGLVKVIPPPEFTPNKSAYKDVQLQEMMIQSPVRPDTDDITTTRTDSGETPACTR